MFGDLFRAFGGRPSGDRLARCEQSPQWRDGRFRNTLPQVRGGDLPGVLRDLLRVRGVVRTPRTPIPTVSRSAADYATPVPDYRVTWLGHSTLLVELEGQRVLTDPVWGSRTSPFPWLGPRRFFDVPLALDALPPLDAVLLSHDHYDHLDADAIAALAERVPRFLAPLGVGAHLERWGVAPDRIAEFDWWDEATVGGVRLVCTPARHFSGRSFATRDTTLWGGWALLGAQHRLYFSGDSAFTPAFAEIGERLGPFHLTMIEVGAYNATWADVHMGPEQAVQAHRLVRGETLLPVHWGTFNLAFHAWTEPAERVRVAAAEAGVPLVLPRPGAFVTPETPRGGPGWWPDVDWQDAEAAPVVSTGLAGA